MKSFESTSSTPFTSRLGKSSDKSRELKLLKKMRAQVEEEKKTWLMEQSRLSLQLTGAGIAPGRTQVRVTFLYCLSFQLL